jgi:hypothetical protein
VNHRHLCAALCVAFLLTACGDKTAEAPAPATPTVSPIPAAAPEVAPAAPAPETASGPVAFDIARIPVTDKPLGDFPFFTPPEGYRYTSLERRDSLDEKESLKEFSRHYFAVGKETLRVVEGKILKGGFYDEKQESKGGLETLLIQRNYENAITAAGGVSVHGALLTQGIAQERLQSAGFGASKPIADNATEEGKARNRRVEIVRL